jgi:hypothetical protein
MAYVDEGQGDAVVFAHGNPTSSYLWRNVMPHLQGLGRLVAADMIGMGGSDKLSPSGPDRYNYAEQRDYLFALWDALDLGDNVTLVLHDWGSVLGLFGEPERGDDLGGPYPDDEFAGDAVTAAEFFGAVETYVAGGGTRCDVEQFIRVFGQGAGALHLNEAIRRVGVIDAQYDTRIPH